MKLYNISNVRQFLDAVLECDGKVSMVNTDGEKQNLKDMAHYLINTGMADKVDRIPELSVEVDSTSDGATLLYFAAHMYKKKTA